MFENLSFRANVIAYLKACVLYVANGMKWEKSIEDFIRWSEGYDLWCKLKLFGQMIYEADNDQSDSPKMAPRGPKNMLLLLPDGLHLKIISNCVARRDLRIPVCIMRNVLSTSGFTAIM